MAKKYKTVEVKVNKAEEVLRMYGYGGKPKEVKVPTFIDVKVDEKGNVIQTEKKRKKRGKEIKGGNNWFLQRGWAHINFWYALYFLASN